METLMNHLETEYRVNEQGMIVEEIEKPDKDELIAKVNLPATNKPVIIDSVAQLGR